ncbi:MAG: MFS transporter, partial [Desulfuromonas sp.]
KSRSAEFFGFYSISSRFAAILGPLFFAVVAQFSGSSRHSILGIGLFFILGMLLLLKVDFTRGRQQALEDD